MPFPDADTSDTTLQKTKAVLELFPGILEEASAVAQYYLPPRPVTSAEAEAAVVEYAKDEYTAHHRLLPSFWDFAVVTEFRELLVRLDLDARRYAVGTCGAEWRLTLWRWLPEKIDQDALEAFWRRHKLEVVELSSEFERAVGRYRTMYPQGSTADGFIHRERRRLQVQAPPMMF